MLRFLVIFIYLCLLLRFLVYSIWHVANRLSITFMQYPLISKKNTRFFLCSALLFKQIAEMVARKEHLTNARRRVT